MKGSTHLAIGVAIGAAASLYYPFSITNAAAYVTVAAISALSADLDGPSLLTSKIGKLSKFVYGLIQLSGWLLIGTIIYLYVTDRYFNVSLTGLAGAIVLIGVAANQGFIRNALVSLIGGCLIFAGFYSEMIWLAGFGLFVAWAPWLKHRGMTHTIWAAALWGVIAYDLEQHLQLEGIMRVAILGYFSHLIADTLTPNGVKWLYPIFKKSFTLH